MRQTEAELTTLVANNFSDNSPDQDILEEHSIEAFTNFNDSLAKKEAPAGAFPFRIKVEDLDAQNKYTLNHPLGTQKLKVVMYNSEGFRLYREYFTPRQIDNNNMELTFIGGIPLNTYRMGYVYKIV